MKLSLNLARRPFVNDRPLIVATAVLVGLVLLATFGNVYLLFDALAESRLLSARLVAEQEEIRLLQEEAKLLGKKLEEREKKRIRLVAVSTAGIIQKRQLSWSRLFDQLELVLPRDVRILQVLPEPRGKYMHLVMACVAKSNEAKLKFYAKLNQPPFIDPYIGDDMMEEGSSRNIRFSVRCLYDSQGLGAEPIWEPMPWEPQERPGAKQRGRRQPARERTRERGRPRRSAEPQGSTGS